MTCKVRQGIDLCPHTIVIYRFILSKYKQWFSGGLLFAVNGPSGPNNVPVQGIIVDMETAETIETFNTPQVSVIWNHWNIQHSTSKCHIKELLLIWRPLKP
jgi:hypothetical protein